MSSFKLDKKVAAKLERLAKFMETKVPRKNFNISTWGHIKGEMDFSLSKANATSCGTACCLAGWQVVRKGFSIKGDAHAYDKNDHKLGCVPDVAMNTLGLTQVGRERLFLPSGWPMRPSKPGYMFPFTPKGAAKRIRHYIKTGE